MVVVSFLVVCVKRTYPERGKMLGWVNGEKITPITTILPQCQTFSDLTQENVVYICSLFINFSSKDSKKSYEKE